MMGLLGGHDVGLVVMLIRSLPSSLFHFVDLHCLYFLVNRYYD